MVQETHFETYIQNISKGSILKVCVAGILSTKQPFVFNAKPPEQQVVRVEGPLRAARDYGSGQYHPHLHGWKCLLLQAP